MLEQQIDQCVQALMPELSGISDAIFDRPEEGLKEYFALAQLTDWLEARGYQVERGVAGVETAFRAVWRNGTGGPNIGLLCEYDALPGLGHACGHHMQGPCILAAAQAMREVLGNTPYTLTIYGTPAEESVSGKIMMIQNGCTFEELDVALMMHAGSQTQVDVKSMANTKFEVTFHGVSAHAAIRPENGRSALDALLLAFQGLEFLREHVREDTRIHYTMLHCGGTPANVVPASAAGSFYVRSYSRSYLNTVLPRFRRVMEGAAMMTETQVEIREIKSVDNKIPSLKLNHLVMDMAKQVGAPALAPAREKTGSTDFGNVMHRVPGPCIRVAFVDPGITAHSQAFLDAGKTQRAHEALAYGARILARTGVRLVKDPQLLREIQEEFRENLQAEQAQI